MRSSIRLARLWIPLTLGVVWLALGTTARALYMQPDLVDVPVDRLIANLEATARANPKDASVRLNLARLQAMAYAQKTGSAQVWRGRESSGAWFGFEPAHVPFTNKPAPDPAAEKIARAHLTAAIASYEQAIALDPTNLTATLGHAWCLEQAGRRAEAIAGYRRVLRDAWAVEGSLSRAPVGWRPVTAETAGYLIPLLDPAKDAAEIATLRERTAQVQRVPRPITPIVVPVRDRMTAFDVADDSTRVFFDADGTGVRKRWTWTSRDGAWLVFDPRGRGEITSALRLFGSVTFWLFWDTGYDALSALDDDRDGEIAGRELVGLALWHDRNRNGISEAREVRPLSAWNIVSVSTRYERDPRHPDEIAFAPRGVTFRDGRTRPTYDIVISPQSSVLGPRCILGPSVLGPSSVLGPRSSPRTAAGRRTD